MAWASPTTPVSGTVITVAWAQSSVVDPINWLRTMTGGADPPGSDYSITSTSTAATTWTQKVTRAGDVMTGDLQVNRNGSAAPTTGYLILGNNTSYYFGFNGTGHVLATPGVQVTGEITLDPSMGVTLGGNAGATRGRLYDSAAALTVLRTHNNAFGVYTNNLATMIFGADNAAAAPTFKGQAIYHTGNVGAFVPSGLIASFATAAAIAAGWTRFTSGDGRFLVGAGTTFSQTFTEGASAGSSWAHLHGTTGTTVGGTGSSAAAAANTANATWIPPSFAIVWAQKS